MQLRRKTNEDREREARRREAEDAARSIEEGSKTRASKNDDGAVQKASPGIFRTFNLSRDEYISNWLRNVYGEAM